MIGAGVQLKPIGGPTLFRHFSGISFFKAAIREWTATDPMLLELSVFGEAIQSELNGGAALAPARRQVLSSPPEARA